MHGRIEKLTEQLAQADRLWDVGDKSEAIEQYKAFLNAEEHYQFNEDLPRVYRRVIEHEAEYGDPGEARQWIRLAWEQWPGNRMRLSFKSLKTNRLWQEVVSELENRD